MVEQTSDMFVGCLKRRIAAVNTLWQRAVSDMTLDQVNHHERAGVLPIAFSLSHFMKSQDFSISGAFLQERPLWVQGEWARKVGVNIDALGREETVEEMEQIRFTDFDAWKAYQAEVVRRIDRVLETLNEALLAEVVMPALPANMQNIFCGLVIPKGGPVRKLEVLECFVYQHGLRHMGEIEHARALVGLKGMTS